MLQLTNRHIKRSTDILSVQKHKLEYTDVFTVIVTVASTLVLSATGTAPTAKQPTSDARMYHPWSSLT